MDEESEDLNNGRIVWRLISNIHHPNSNPDGCVSRDVSGNALTHEEVAESLPRLFGEHLNPVAEV